ncbi:hypothetical protein niasHT_005169 [Heterodera trifolii]|uniref:Uncharacterized protein n=1 Tax=Heterodera trifolii TaxID=157864 RepID=A0ABD2LS32_9BILA
MHFSIDELSLYLNSVAHFPFLRAVPTFPAQIYQGQNIDENFNTMDITAMLDPAERIVEARNDFPTFAGKSWRQLSIERRVADINLNGTLDSLASPILDLRRMPSRKKVREMFAGSNSKAESQNKKIDNSKSENWNKEMDNETGFKSVLSKKGLTLRLLNSNADTPPGFYSSRSIIKK